MVHQLFVSGDDPYAGADLPSSRNATAVLVALHGVLNLATILHLLQGLQIPHSALLLLALGSF